MPFNGSGTFTPIAAPDYPAVAATTIKALSFNLMMADLMAGLGLCVTKDGQTTLTANLPMGGYKHTGAAAGTLASDYATFGQLVAAAQNTGYSFAAGGGTADAITGSFTPVIAALTDGMIVFVRATAANTIAAPTFTAFGLGAKPIVKQGVVALAAGDIVGAGHILILQYDLALAKWQLHNPGTTLAATVKTVAAGNLAATTVQGALAELDSEKQAALGFTPYNSTNPSGYTSNAGVAMLAGAAFTGNISAPVVTETSDERKKENWRSLTDAQLDALGAMSLVGVFDWRDGSGSSLGGSAQEIEAIVPEAVHTDANGFKTVGYGGLTFAVVQGMLCRMLEAKP